MDTEIKWLGVAVLSIILFFVSFGFCFGFIAYKYDVEIGSANIVKVILYDFIVYEGKKAFVDIQSGGMTTTITIYKKLFPFKIKDKVYSEAGIKVF